MTELLLSHVSHVFGCWRNQAIHKSAKVQMDTTPIGSGWHEDGDHFAIDWMSGDPAVLEPKV